MPRRLLGFAAKAQVVQLLEPHHRMSLGDLALVHSFTQRDGWHGHVAGYAFVGRFIFDDEQGHQTCRV